MAPAGLYLIRIESSENKEHSWSGKSLREAERVFANCYPSVYAFMKARRESLISRHDQGRYFWELRSCRYWDDFARPKITSTKVSREPTFAIDKSGSYLGNTSYFFAPQAKPLYLLGLLNSSVSAFYGRSVFVDKQNGWYEVQPDALEAFCVPDATSFQADVIEAVVTYLIHDPHPRLEQLINGLVYELFFPDDLHAAGVRLFDACKRENITRLATLQGAALQTEADTLAERIFSNNHPIYMMMFDLQTLDVVRIIEARD